MLRTIPRGGHRIHASSSVDSWLSSGHHFAPTGWETARGLDHRRQELSAVADAASEIPCIVQFPQPL